ncbi:MAG: hypothetical protein IT261_01520 [Saprospiraceae bacterium]|nr:hypothetical protein [Saprospiraceae bacterium]
MRTLLLSAFLLLGVTLHAQSTKPEPAETPTPAPKPAYRSPGVNISGPTTICKGGEAILKAEGDYESFEWNTGVQDRFLRVREEGTYEVTVVTKGGCRLTSSVTVRVLPCI